MLRMIGQDGGPIGVRLTQIWLFGAGAGIDGERSPARRRAIQPRMRSMALANIRSSSSGSNSPRSGRL
jgi:hypothetical protein